ncbi:MAG: hypothetical protein KDD47_06945 [Acidobacteria bacterium]|nr:hypothetical protein [Acidobacteriota bacterium]
MKHWSSVLLVGMLVATCWVTTSKASPPPLGQLSVCGSGDAAAPSIERAYVEGDSLFIGVWWPDQWPASASALLEISDRDGAAVAREVVVGEEGRLVAYPVTRDASFFETEGYWFEAQVLDALGQPLSAPIPVLVTLCGAGEGCTYRVVERVGSDGLAMEEELSQLLDDLRARGSLDLLGDALRIRPDLEHQIYWVGDQISRLIPSATPLECACFWHTAYELEPSDQEFEKNKGGSSWGQPLPDWEQLTFRGPGPNDFIAAQILGGDAMAPSVSTGAGLDLHLRCNGVTSWVQVSWGGVPLKFPIVRPCSAGCTDAQVAVAARAQSWVGANALASADRWVRSRSRAFAELYLDDPLVPVLTAEASTGVEREPGDKTLDLAQKDSGLLAGKWVLPGSDGAITFVALGELELCQEDEAASEACAGEFVRPEDDSGPWAFGCAASSSAVTLTGTASCATSPVEASVAFEERQPPVDGLVVLPWKP